MYLDERGYSVLELIVNNPAISGKEIENNLGLSRKQLSYTIEKINDYLLDNEFPKIERLRTGKFVVPVPVLEEYQKQEVVSENTIYVYSENERTYLIFLTLFCSKDSLSIYHFTSKLDISKNTFLTDVKKLEAQIEKYELDIIYSRQDGYHLVGSEYAKRDAMIVMIRNVLKMPNGKAVIFKTCNLEEKQVRNIKNEISEIENKLQIRFTDERLNELLYILSLVLIRNEKKRIIKELPEEFQHVAGTKEYSVVTEFAKKYQITSATERLFLAAQIQISNFHGFQNEVGQDENEILRVSQKTIKEFEKIACVTFQEREALLEALQQHIKPALYRIKYHYHIEQSIKDMVLPQYHSLHMMVRKSIRFFEEYLKADFPDEELVYITALFGGWLRREGMINISNKRKRALVVCANGVSVSNFLFFTLQELFPEIEFIKCLSMREFNKYQEDFDIVFSMVRLETDKIQFLAKPFFDEKSKRKFREKVLGELNGVIPHQIEMADVVNVIEKYAIIQDKSSLMKELKIAMGVSSSNSSEKHQHKIQNQIELKNVLTEDMIQITNQHLQWKEAIQMVAKPLLHTKAVTKRYVEKSIESIQEDKPYIMIAEGVIIAHAGVEDGVNRVCISLLTLPEKIDINGYMHADVILMIGTPDATKHLLMLSQVNEILEDKELLRQVKEAKKIEDILKIVNREKEK